MFVIVGLVVIILLTLLLRTSQKKEGINNDNSLSNFQEYFDACALDAIIKSNVLYGFIENKMQYESSMSSLTDSCMQPYLESQKEKGFNIKKEKTTSSALEVNENTINVKIIFPVDITRGDTRFSFSDYTKTFERLKKVDLKDVKNKPVVSSDGVIKLEFEDNGELSSMYGDGVQDFMIVRLEDKVERNGGLLAGNLIYGLLPVQYISSSPINICFYLDKLLPGSDIKIEDLRVMFWNPNSNRWGLLESQYKDGCLGAKVNYTTFYGVIKVYSPVVLGEVSFNPWDNLPGSTINAPPPDFEIYRGSSNEIFEKVRADMGGPWPLIDDPQCAQNVITSGAFCIASAGDCGTGIYCLPNINSMDDAKQNLLFRHEITHSIQIMNDIEGDICASGSPRREWGAEFYSDTQCYDFIIDGKGKYSARQLAEEMKTKNPECTEDLLMDAAFCNPGSYEKLEELDCLIGSNGDIADSDPGKSCVNV